MRKRNIIWFLLAINVLSIALISPNVSPHAASGMSLTYDFNTQELSVSVTHSVANPSSHYILSVTIRVNGTIVSSEVYTNQPTTMTFTYLYNITAGHEANIQVTIVCNLTGTISRTLIVGDSNGETPPEIPGYSIVWILGVTALVIIIFIRRKIRFKFL